MTQRRQVLKALAATAGLSAPFASAFAQADYPTKPIRLLVPFGAGSTPDVFARLVSEHASKTLGQPIVMENRAGAGGNIATGMMAKAAPDGYTIGVSITGPLVNNTIIYDNLGYDPFKELQPITFGVHRGNVLAVSPSLGVDTIQQLMALLRKNPGKYNYASVGVGTLSQLSVEAIKALTNSYVVQVPYASSPAAVMSVLQGDTHIVSPGAAGRHAAGAGGQDEDPRGVHGQAPAAAAQRADAARIGHSARRQRHGSGSSRRPAFRRPSSRS
ncbi:tripartite tricarboxylate transporter substrate binding protein [Ramlibacter terrae]|uniref:Tripartite tricarboxylate transporter substrate binding protein n=1 Tax=Ramlibacter terrae TaxID=2732511 RepID=A0ABX6P4N3_9BURK|nr:tripartite tricarboxylate transporter substrate binding protein [Ramlibacter terrae]